MREKYLDGLVEQVNDECERQVNDYYLSEDYIENYCTFPIEEDFMHACYYGNKEETTLEQQHKLQELREKYGFDCVEDLLMELYDNCKIETVHNDIHYYNPVDVISFGTYAVEEVESTLSTELQKKLEQITIEEFKYIQESSNLNQILISPEFICLCLDLLISYELSINKAIEYLDSLKG